MRPPALIRPLAGTVFSLILLLAAAALLAADESSDFTKGVRMGLRLTADNRLAPFSLYDNFNDDTRTKYRVITRTDSLLNELGYMPLNDRAGVFYSSRNGALYIEAGSGDAAGIERTLPPLSDCIIRVRFRVMAVFPGPVNAVMTVLSEADEPLIHLALNAHHDRPHALTTAGTTTTAESVRGYLPIAPLGGPAGDDIDRLPLAIPALVETVIIRSAGRCLVQLNGTELFTVPAADGPARALRMVFSGQEVQFESLAVLALRGTYESPVIALTPGAVPTMADLVTATADTIGADIALRLAGSAELKDLARVDWQFRPELTGFPAEITPPLSSATCLRYRLELTIRPPFIIPGPGDELPSINYIMFKRDR